MVTTNSDRRADPASATLSGNGDQGRGGVKAKVAVGLAVLGCAAALAFGGLRPGDDAVQTQPAAGAPSVAAPASRSEQQFLERNLTLPIGTLPGAIVTREQQRFLEQNRWLPEVPNTLPRAQQHFLELNTVLPTEPAPAIVPGKPR